MQKRLLKENNNIEKIGETMGKITGWKKIKDTTKEIKNKKQTYKNRYHNDLGHGITEMAYYTHERWINNSKNLIINLTSEYNPVIKKYTYSVEFIYPDKIVRGKNFTNKKSAMNYVMENMKIGQVKGKKCIFSYNNKNLGTFEKKFNVFSREELDSFQKEAYKYGVNIATKRNIDVKKILVTTKPIM
jgi:hypothetical protein